MSKKITNSNDSLPLISSEYDIFISFVVEDRDFVNTLFESLSSKLDVKIWYSTTKLREGKQSFLFYDINEAIRLSNYCVAVFSKNTISSKWFWGELGAFYAKETLTDRKIIPILYKWSYEDFLHWFPLLADRFAITNYQEIERVTMQIAKFVCENQSVIRPDAFHPIIESNNTQSIIKHDNFSSPTQENRD